MAAFLCLVNLFVNENSIKLNCPFQVINQTRERELLQDIRTPRSGLKKRGTAEFFKPTSSCLDT